MIVVDETDVTAAAVSEGVRIAAACGAPVVFIQVIGTYVFAVGDWAVAAYQQLEDFKEQAQAQSKKIMARAAAAATQAGVGASQLAVSGEDKAVCIAQHSVKQHCDLIVIGSHGRTTMQRLIHGSVVTNLITLSALPVLVCKLGKRVSIVRRRPTARSPAKGARARPRAK